MQPSPHRPHTHTRTQPSSLTLFVVKAYCSSFGWKWLRGVENKRTRWVIFFILHSVSRNAEEAGCWSGWQTEWHNFNLVFYPKSAIYMSIYCGARHRVPEPEKSLGLTTLTRHWALSYRFMRLDETCFKYWKTSVRAALCHLRNKCLRLF